MKFFVLRHAKHDYGIRYKYTDKGLVDKAKADLNLLIPKLRNLEIVSLIASFTTRSQETALIIRKKLQLPCLITLSDFDPLGLPRGEKWEIIQNLKSDTGKAWQELWLQNKCIGMEPPIAFLNRLELAIGRIKHYLKKGNVLLIAHEETVWGLNVLLNNKTWEEAIKIQVLPASLHNFNIIIT